MQCFCQSILEFTITGLYLFKKKKLYLLANAESIEKLDSNVKFMQFQVNGPKHVKTISTAKALSSPYSLHCPLTHIKALYKKG